MEKLVIAGAGLAGSLMGIMLAQKGYQVEIYERRPDMRLIKQSAGRSINLALSDRGLAALDKVDLKEKVLSFSIPMKSRLIHDTDGNTNYQKYSGRKGKWINSVSRAGLNIALMDEAEKYDNLKILFDRKIYDIDYGSNIVTVENQLNGMMESVEAEVIFGADGAGSAVRKTMMDGGIRRFSFSQAFLEHGYKELEIPAGDNGSFLIENNVLHIWPRGEYMMIALPNIDGSFTCTLFMPFGGENGFDNLNNEQKVSAFFNSQFPDAVDLMPTLLDDFFSNPTSDLATIRCSPWNKDNKAVLLGDAAHAVVPFYGQGMNASFEDCLVLNNLIELKNGDWNEILPLFTQQRIENANAIADLALENYLEMRNKTANPKFVEKRKLELEMESKFPEFDSKYSMVTFRPDLEYSYAHKKGNIQDRMLMELCQKKDQLSLEEIYSKVKAL